MKLRQRSRPDPEHAFTAFTRPLRPKETSRLSDAGVSLTSYPIRAAGVVIHGERFSLPGEFRVPEGIVGAFILPIYNEARHFEDLACFVPQTKTLATWQGCGWALGQEEFPYPLCILHENDAVAIFREPFEWLRADCQGLVILDRCQARWRFAREGVPLIASDISHARDLKRLVTIPQVPILLPRSSVRSAA